MALLAGERLGTYEVLKPIGVGGMGEVYQARDTRLGRTVAIKVLPSHLASRPELRERFEREARTIAGLNHPNICTLYDVGHQNGTDYLVLEHLEGETLAERLTKGPLPLDRVLDYAIEISDALDKAHRKGITHRDLKPANIMLTKSGAKLLDFGVAKLRDDGVLPADEGPTAFGARPLTGEGTIVGTLHYMAPEQVEGRVADIDGRTDLFAFGAVVYEMATGQKAFEGKSSASVIAKILDHDPPPISSSGKLSPPSLDRIVKICLAKDADGRWQSAGDLCRELKWIKESGSKPEKHSPQPSRRVLPWVAAALMSAAVGVVVWILRPVATQPVSRFTISLPPGQRLAALDQPAIAISPDGKNLVYVATDGISPQQLYLRPLDSLETRPIAGTEGAMSPFFSADGRWVGFFASGKLKKVSVDSGSVATLADAASSGGGSWSSQGVLAFQAQALRQVSQEGGTPQSLTQLGTPDGFHRWPEFLPGGNALLFVGSPGTSAWNNTRIVVQPVGGGERKNLAQGTQPRYAATGHLLYAQGGTLMAAPFDVPRLAVTGTAVRALEGVLQSTGSGSAQYSVSTTGTIVYVAGGLFGTDARMAWVSRDGEEQLLPAPPRTYQFPRVSPDGRRIAVSVAGQEAQIWVYDVSRDTLARLTFEGNANQNAVWSPDGQRIAFRSYREGRYNLAAQAVDGSGAVESLTGSSENITSPNSFSPDGQLLAFMEQTPETFRDVWVLNLADRKAQPFLKTPYEESAPKFSPDGKWVAYSSDESGRREIYLQPYPGPGAKRQISTEGGQEPVWNPKGGELFYRIGKKVMAVDFEPESGFSAGNPRMLFEGPYVLTSASFPFYDVSPDGERFLMLKPVDTQATAPTQIHVVLNWHQELKQKIP